MKPWIIGGAATMALVLVACAPAKPAPPEPASLEDGNRCMTLRDYRCAAANYAGYLKAYPNDGTTSARLGIARTRAGLHREALPAYAKAEEMGVVTYDLFANYALSLDAAGDLDGAIRANRKALEIVPSLVDVRGSLAQQLVRKGQTDEAIKLLESFDRDLKRQGQPAYFTAQISSIREKAGK